MGNESDLIVDIRSASVEIPLRGVRVPQLLDDSRITTSGRTPVLRALDSITLRIRRGERIGIRGSNGSGKTTLLKLIGGMLPSTSGTVLVGGSIRTLLTPSAGTVAALTGRQNARLRYALLEVRGVTEADYIDDVASFADLGTFFDMPIGTYSPGMQSRLQFAMSTVEPAELLLLDEWMGVADREFHERAHHRLSTYVAKNEALALASHSDSLLAQMTTRQITLGDGRITHDTAWPAQPEGESRATLPVHAKNPVQVESVDVR